MSNSFASHIEKECLINSGFNRLKRRTDSFFQMIEENSLEGFTEVGIVEIVNCMPESAFREETMDIMRVPFERAAESMEDTEKAGNKVLDLLRERKRFLMTSETASKRQLSKSLSSRKK
ncbi:hypothetical protein GCM10008910_36230 [Faecalicatena orotica]|uniref:Uncharacterized protein n=1 Tax=Faecalicatena orotica TaxID=1544 RepID=A0A2Y9BD66_9FIRM|nr:hypothetical protein [Faecalicatena orotica]PWJ29752.1 hypothetical protein A8806_10552 [Faecalicatena orotica]SSA55476.1 hypothetical protein SAMN05216536_10552 [Faecalicatena orotica]